MSRASLDGREALLGFGLSAVSALCYALMPLLAKAAYRLGAEPLELLSLRFLLAVPLFWGAALLLRRDVLAVGWRRSAAFAAAGLLFGLASICIFYAYRWIDAWLAAILLYTYPPLVGLWGRLFRGERLGAAGLAALGAAFLGVVLTVGAPGLLPAERGAAGAGLALLAALLYSLYCLVTQGMLGETGPLVFTSYSVTATFLLMAVITPPLGVVRRAGWELLGVAAVIAFVCTFLAIYTYARSIRHIGATRASVVSNLEPVGVAALSWLVLGERFTPAQAAGGLLILAGVYLLPSRGRGGGGENAVDSRR